MKRILFLCVANSARSQMAEGLARSMAPQGTEVFSAGSEPATVNPLAVAALGEIGIDIASHRSKGVDALPIDSIDLVVTLCAEEVCPVFPAPVEKLHWPLPDPAAASGTDEDRLRSFCEVRDEIRRRLAGLFRTGGEQVS